MEKPKTKKKADSKKKPKEEPKVEPKVEPEAQPEIVSGEAGKDIEDYDLGEPTLGTEEAAANFVSFVLEMAEEFSSSYEELKEFWGKNKSAIDLLDRQWPSQYDALKEGFTKLKQQFDDEENTDG